MSRFGEIVKEPETAAARLRSGLLRNHPRRFQRRVQLVGHLLAHRAVHMSPRGCLDRVETLVSLFAAQGPKLLDACSLAEVVTKNRDVDVFGRFRMRSPARRYGSNSPHAESTERTSSRGSAAPAAAKRCRPSRTVDRTGPDRPDPPRDPRVASVWTERGASKTQPTRH